MDGLKTVEIRHMPLAAGVYFVGRKNWLKGVIVTGTPRRMTTFEEFEGELSLHRWGGLLNLPYKTTWALPITQAVRFEAPQRYYHPRGAIGLVVYKQFDEVPLDGIAAFEGNNESAA